MARFPGSANTGNLPSLLSPSLGYRPQARQSTTHLYPNCQLIRQLDTCTCHLTGLVECVLRRIVGQSASNGEQGGHTSSEPPSQRELIQIVQRSYLDRQHHLVRNIRNRWYGQ
ncbi:hypothetical protein FA15DRAFT_668502 [Coprinopsis marcescibilis]|uniref:Uncharacterized protein n=1 Tax=Coprinopsis marcescibilis TaxID=230819 RepID=A0A5C3KXY6_COPMA|nr:hypothetical protein FA15DRAFT_668502 [Coprinopsis marcescibilis]